MDIKSRGLETEPRSLMATLGTTNTLPPSAGSVSLLSFASSILVYPCSLFLLPPPPVFLCLLYLLVLSSSSSLTSWVSGPPSESKRNVWRMLTCANRLLQILSANEKRAHRIARHLADYVLVWAGGGGDDLAKSPHMARIGNSVFHDICSEPTCSEFGFYQGG